MAGSQRLMKLVANHVDQFVDDGGIVLKPLRLANHLKDCVELRVGKRADVYLGLDAAQEGRVDQRCGIEVGGEDNEHLEGNLHLPTSGQREEVDPAIERNHPAVQQLFGTNALAAEVIDDQHTVVGFHLHGSRVVLGDRIELQ